MSSTPLPMSPPNLTPQLMNLPSSQQRGICIAHRRFLGAFPRLLNGLFMGFKKRNHHDIVQPPAPLAVPSSPASPTTSGTTRHSHPGEEYVSGQGRDQFDALRVTIESLPDDVLLDISYSYQRGPYGYLPYRWRILVRVCQRWRCIVFAFPHRLDLRLECNAKTAVRKTLDVWPSLPIVVRDRWTRKWPVLFGDNIIAALERHHRMCGIELHHLPCPLFEQLLRVMDVPFPVLTLLDLDLGDKSVPAPMLPDTFLGGSAPRLQHLALSGIPFPTLPKFLQSSHDLVEIRLTRIPNTGYISSKSMATALSAMSKLEVLEIGFESPAARPERNAIPSTRVVLPSLTQLDFHGNSEYFEDLVTGIDTPSIRFVKTEFFNQLVFDNPQFLQFVGRTKMLGSFKRAILSFGKSMAKFSFDNRRPSAAKSEAYLHIHILCDALDWQVSGLTQIFVQFSTFLSNVDRCGVRWTKKTRPLEDDMDHTQWLELFLPFTSVQTLGIRSKLDSLISPALNELTGDRVMEVLPALHTLSVYGKKSLYEPFITARQLSNHPVILE
ncbi:hypothetical protein BGW80DRAFT_82885 [Lactifluus volemus]|nr:hypothetical protein BGW80DRAFT_82885 [Lactifluus volemus]